MVRIFQKNKIQVYNSSPSKLHPRMSIYICFLRREIDYFESENKTYIHVESLKVIYHPLYGMNNYVLIWGDWLSCDPLRGSHDSQSPHIRNHLCPILWQLRFICHKIIHTI